MVTNISFQVDIIKMRVTTSKIILCTQRIFWFCYRKKEAPEKDNQVERKNVPKNTENKPRKEQDNLVGDKVKENESVGNVGDIKQAQGVSKDEKEKSPVKRRESVVPRPGSARPGSRKMAHGKFQLFS